MSPLRRVINPGSAEKIKIPSPVVLFFSFCSGRKKKKAKWQQTSCHMAPGNNKKKKNYFAVCTLQHLMFTSQKFCFADVEWMSRVLSIAATALSAKHWKLISARTFFPLLKTTTKKRETLRCRQHSGKAEFQVAPQPGLCRAVKLAWVTAVQL